MRRARAALVVTVGMFSVGTSTAAEVYRCQVNGVPTFVGSLADCPTGTAARQDVRPTPAPVRSPRSEPTVRSSRSGSYGEAPLSRKAACRAKGSERDPRCGLAVEADAPKRAANDHLAIMTKAVTSFSAGPPDGSGLIAAFNKGRSPAWCEAFLRDFVKGRGIEPVTDESLGGPRWIGLDGQARQAAPIVDPTFQSWSLPQGVVVNGHVTVRRGGELLAVRMAAACFVEAGRPHCNRWPYVGLYVYDDKTPTACNVSMFGHAYWGNWQATTTPLKLR